VARKSAASTSSEANRQTVCILVIEWNGRRHYRGHMQNIRFHEVDVSRWDDFERLFESRGGPRSCWCMVWRAGAKTAKGPDRKAAMRRYVGEGVPIGLLGYSSGQPVAWCSIAPRTTYRDLGGPTNISEFPEDVWSLVCFFIRRDLRGKGLTKRIIEAAVQHAAKRGAKVVEAYPVEPGSPSYRFMGYLPTFSAAGFHEVGRAGTRRHVMRRELRK
jgi:GNAT superfamily N-acetyltransferase